MVQASQNNVLWTVVFATLVLLVAGFIGVGSINTNSNDAASDVARQIDNKIDTKLDTALSQLQQTASALQNIDTTISVDPSLCNNIDGCGDVWDVDNRETVAERVLEELTEDNEKDLFRLMERAGIDIDDATDIDSNLTDVFKEGEILTNQDPRFKLDEDTVTTADIVIEVTYKDNDGHVKTDYFRVQSTLDELEDGYDSGDVSIDDFNEVRKRFVLPSR